MPSSRPRWRTRQSQRLIRDDRTRHQPAYVNCAARVLARGSEELSVQSADAGWFKGRSGEEASVAAVRESAPQTAVAAPAVPRSRPAASGHIGSVMRNCASAPLQSRFPTGRARLRGVGALRGGDCASRRRKSRVGRRDCAGVSAPDPAGARAGRAQVRLRDCGSRCVPHFRTSTHSRPPFRLALPKRCDFWIMDFVEPSKTIRRREIGVKPS